MSKHTPSPWAQNKTVVFHPVSHRAIAWCEGEEAPFPPDPEECEANARLIAAAPELYEALKALVEHFTWYDPDVYYDSISLIEPARAVLANIAKD